MKRTIVVALALSLVAGAMTAPAMAKKKKPKKPVRVERVQESRYEMPWGFSLAGTGACSGCPSFPNGEDETWIKVEVIDDAAPSAEISLSWDTDGDGIADTGVNVCGATDGFVAIPGSVSPTAFPSSIGGPECPGSAATSGAIKVTYANMP